MSPHPKPPFTTKAHHHTGLLGSLADLLITLEATHHDAGWGNTSPTLYRITQTDHKLDLVAVSLLGTHPGVHARDELAAIAAGASNPLARPLLAPSGEPRPVAHCLVMETWVREPNPDPVVDDQVTAGRYLADIPGTREARTAIAATDGHEIIINRIQREDPTIAVTDLTDPDWELGGNMRNSLHQLHNTITGIYLSTPFAAPQ